MRRLWVLLKGLPPDALWRLSFQAEIDKANKPTVEQIRERQAYYDRQRAKEA